MSGREPTLPRPDELLPGPGHWGRRFFGELYRLTTLPLLSQERTAADASTLLRLLALPAGSLVLDLGCGHGRHAVALAAAGLRVIGLDLDEPSLALASVAARGARVPLPLVQAELTALPLRGGSLDGAYAFYSSLFLWDDATNAALLASIASALRPGGVLVHQSVSAESLAARPAGSVRFPLPRGGEVIEESRFDPETGRDQGLRTVILSGGRRLSAGFSIRYHGARELESLARAAGFSLVEALPGEAVGLEPGALVLVARR